MAVFFLRLAVDITHIMRSSTRTDARLRRLAKASLGRALSPEATGANSRLSLVSV